MIYTHVSTRELLIMMSTKLKLSGMLIWYVVCISNILFDILWSVGILTFQRQVFILERALNIGCPDLSLYSWRHELSSLSEPRYGT